MNPVTIYPQLRCHATGHKFDMPRMIICPFPSLSSEVVSCCAYIMERYWTASTLKHRRRSDAFVCNGARKGHLSKRESHHSTYNTKWNPFLLFPLSYLLRQQHIFRSPKQMPSSTSARVRVGSNSSTRRYSFPLTGNLRNPFRRL